MISIFPFIKYGNMISYENSRFNQDIYSIFDSYLYILIFPSFFFFYFININKFNRYDIKLILL